MKSSANSFDPIREAELIMAQMLKGRQIVQEKEQIDERNLDDEEDDDDIMSSDLDRKEDSSYHQ